MIQLVAPSQTVSKMLGGLDIQGHVSFKEEATETSSLWVSGVSVTMWDMNKGSNGGKESTLVAINVPTRKARK